MQSSETVPETLRMKATLSRAKPFCPANVSQMALASLRAAMRADLSSETSAVEVTLFPSPAAVAEAVEP